ncbi:MAG: hypothetical protein HYV26_13725 [Candidatus Hydrogenedentes bacterium]|nr:hypothetical protein [Candidatus Hydrogenedentota bacterium]
MKIDKFSFCVGVVLVITILGCIGAVTIDDGGRFEWIGTVAWSESQSVGIFDRQSGTVNVWNPVSGNATVYRFRTQ